MTPVLMALTVTFASLDFVATRDICISQIVVTVSMCTD